jgi:ABC-2 type transport system ATP-binding protein
MATIVETHGLTKRYGRLTAVEDMELNVQEGEVYGFLGPNGSGKTTTILMLLGLTEPTGGTARVCGFDPLREPLKVKRQVSYLPENVGFFPDLTAWENLRYTASLNNIRKAEADRHIADLLEQVGLAEDAGRPVGQYSRGMRQRLGVADVLVKQPKVAFLDDPTLGLDPEGIQELLDMIVRMSREQGITIFLSSHLLHQVQLICDRISIMFRGRMVAQGTMGELSQAEDMGGIRIEVQAEGMTADLRNALGGLAGVNGVGGEGDVLVLDCDEDVRAQVAQAVVSKGLPLLSLRAVDRTLEEIYLRYFHQAEEAVKAGR